MPGARIFPSTIYCGRLIYELFQAVAIMCSKWGGQGGRARHNNHKGLKRPISGMKCNPLNAGGSRDSTRSMCVYTPGSLCLPGQQRPESPKSHFAWYITFIRLQGEKNRHSKRHKANIRTHAAEKWNSSCCKQRKHNPLFCMWIFLKYLAFFLFFHRNMQSSYFSA